MTSWLYPANTKFYDVLAAFEETVTYWPMSSKVQAGDTVYIYLAAPYKQVAYVCSVKEVSIPADAVIDECRRFFKGDQPASKPNKQFMALETTRRISIDPQSPLSLASLKPQGLNGMLMGPRKLNNNLPLLEYIQANL